MVIEHGAVIEETRYPSSIISLLLATQTTARDHYLHTSSKAYLPYIIGMVRYRGFQCSTDVIGDDAQLTRWELVRFKDGRFMRGCTVPKTKSRLVKKAHSWAYMSENQAVVLTTQILVNHLKGKGDRKTIIPTCIDLLILDECHQTHDNHPYSIIVNVYNDMKQREPRGKLPNSLSAA